ncbi:hypothetical protein [Helicobacter brantae]|uniref:Protein hydE n=1 Tax=Helicobacter brantae TaxID=375927 RepID=A0A3D8J3Z8_9HELI|nr:hypothetical protein [Helicobacter brantae]RDU72242.1 hypothetical protein CQA58_01155 [Helicobacter brantae]
MIFELSFENRGFSSRLNFFLQNILGKYEGLQYSIFEKEAGDLRLWIECDELERLEQITQELSEKIPQSLYLDEISSNSLPSQALPSSMPLTPIAPTSHFCPQCLNTQEGKCEVCLQEFPTLSPQASEEIIEGLLQSQNIALKTPSGVHILSLKPSERVYCVDIEKILEICTISKKELNALASYEKPIVRVKPYGEAQNNEFLSLSLAQDKILVALFEKLKERGVSFVYGAKSADREYDLAEVIEEGSEIVVYENEHFALLKTPYINQSLLEKFNAMQSLDKSFLSTIIAENHLEEQNILHFYFSLKGGDKICLYNTQTQWFNEVMSFELPKDLFSLIEGIKTLDENSQRLIENYTLKFPTLLAKNIDFSSFPQGIYGIWEIVRVVLGLQNNPLQIAQNNLDKRGVAIDYVFEKDSVILQKFNLARCIRSGMSFKMAGVEDELISLGYIESFTHLPSKLYIALRNLVEIGGIALSGDMLSYRMIGDFLYFNNRQTSIYRNKNFPLLFER